MPLIVKPGSHCRWDSAGLGEIMLRLDPGEGRIHTARQFHVWQDGGEYNVARGLRRCFGLRAPATNAWGAIALYDQQNLQVPQGDVEIFDRRPASTGLGTTSVQLSERKSGFLVPKRHQVKDSDF